MVNAKPAADLQAQLDREWSRACDWLDKGEPLTERFHQNMTRYWQVMTRFEAVERSLRRAGFTGCTSGGRCETLVVSCRACVEREQGVQGTLPASGEFLWLSGAARR